ncbi:MAG TPA: TolC family protein [Kiritimatiellia bacterium]|nr:TolC family protein [Kiritimatiellia bacterium]HMP34116.1 TolC family protein [Kiritimatiellia bacterium]
MKTLSCLMVLGCLAVPCIQAQEVLTLEQAWRIALAESPTEAIVAARSEQALARARQARSAYQPRLDATGSGARINYSDALRELNPALDGSDDEFGAALRATYLLWDGGTRRARLDAATFGAEAAAFSQRDARLDLLANVGRAFTTAQLARENLRIANADAAFQNRQLEDVRIREAAGDASRADRLNFDIRRLGAENAAVSAQADFEAAMAALGALLGLEATDTLPPPAPVDLNAAALPAPELESAWNEALEFLPVLRQAQAQVEAARASIGIARGDYRPTISAFGDLAGVRKDDPGFESDDFGTVVGAQIAWSLWDGGDRRGRVEEAESALREAEAGARSVLLQAYSRLATALTDYAAAVRAEQITGETLALSLENRNLVEKAFRAGQENLLRLNEAQRDFTNAEALAMQARLTREQGWIDLQRARGLLLPPDAE